MFAAPDVAMAEAAISTFATIFFIVCFEKYYDLQVDAENGSTITENGAGVKKHIIPLGFTVFLFTLFVFFIPDSAASTYLKDQYVSMFLHDVGGENAVTAIYLGYRVYDTLFEALMLLVSVVAVAHLSLYGDVSVTDGKRSDISRSPIAAMTIRAICPVILLFGVYLIMNGHFTPGGGFQGGVALAAFVVCRYMIYDIYDTQAGQIVTREKLGYVAIVLLSVFFIFFGAYAYLPQYRTTYLLMMNALIGMKVTCGFIIIFYRYIAFEKR
jgi:multicomponent Na+:H+ antiporter subunit B